MKDINLGMFASPLMQWGGGIDFLTNMLNGISSIKEDLNKVYILCLDEEKNRLESIVEEINKGFVIVTIQDLSKNSLLNCINEKSINCLMPLLNSLGEGFPIPWIGYISDFQHKYYPEFFSKSELMQRDKSFYKLLFSTSSVLVNSKSVYNDIQKFYENSHANIYSLPFSPVFKNEWNNIDALSILNKYNLAENYFLISNQFWMHKSHTTAFAALKLMYGESNKYQSVKLVCTGSPSDYRNNNYFNKLISEISDLGITRDIIFLGYIPKVDQIAIMQNALAVIQPTLFEGGPGGGATYDAIAIGTPVIMSDIPVNLEVNKGEVLFFKVGSPEDLSYKMIEFLEKEKKSDRTTESLVKSSQENVRKLGETLLECIIYSIESFEQKFKNERNIIFLYSDKGSKEFSYNNVPINYSLNDINENHFFTVYNNDFYFDESFFKIANLYIDEHDLIISELQLNKKNGESFYNPVSAKYLYEIYNNRGIAFPYIVFRKKYFVSRDNKQSRTSIKYINGALVNTSVENYIINVLFRDIPRHGRIYVYGGGGHTRELLEEVSFDGFNICGIIDSNQNMTGKFIENIPVYSLSNIRESEVDKILISSASFEMEIYEDLLHKFGVNKLVRIYG